MEKQLTTETEKNTDLLSTIEKLKSQISMKDDQINQCSENLEEKNEESIKHQKHVGKLEKDMVRVKSEAQALKMQGNELDTQLHAKLTAAHNEYATIKDKLREREAEYAQLKEDNEAQHVTSQKLRGSMNDFKRNFENMKKKFEDRDHKLREMRTHYLQEEKSLNELKHKLEAETSNEEKIKGRGRRVSCIMRYAYEIATICDTTGSWQIFAVSCRPPPSP